MGKINVKITYFRFDEKFEGSTNLIFTAGPLLGLLRKLKC